MTHPVILAILGVLSAHSAKVMPVISVPPALHAPAPSALSPTSRSGPSGARIKTPARNRKSDATLEIVREGIDHMFSVIVQIENLDTGDELEYRTESGKEAPSLKPGRYEALTLSSSQGFPQEAKYQVIGKDGGIVRAFERSHVPVTHIKIGRAEHLRIVIPPAVRPYNAVFYYMGKDKTPVAHVIARPYPSNDFEPGMFNGNEQFNSFPLALAFLGEKAARDNPKRAEHIRKLGVQDPVIVLGAEGVAERLAKTFVAERHEQKESYRSPDHIGFLIQRQRDGSLPQELLTMHEGEVAKIFGKEILTMIRHNVHRHNEGGGYARKTFEEDIAEAREKLRAWPLISFQSTQKYVHDARAFEESVRYRGKTVLVSVEDQHGAVKEIPAQTILTQSLVRMVRAAYRERLHLLSFGPADLRPLEEAMDQTAASRATELERLIHTGLQRLSEVDPGAEKNVIPSL